MPSLDPALLADESLLRPGDSVSAILVLDDGRLVLQLRDSKPGIFFPGYWSLFGGACDPGESDEDALRREVAEELGVALAPGQAQYFTRFDFALAFCGLPGIHRTFYTVVLPASVLPGLTVTEGQGLRAFTTEELMLEPYVAPYDAFALWLFVNQRRLIA